MAEQTPTTPQAKKPSATEQLTTYFDHLDGQNLELYLSTDHEQPYVKIPGDKTKVYYLITSDRTQTWLWAEYLDVCGEPPLPGHLKSATAYLKDQAYTEGLKLPTDDDDDCFSDDPVLVALHSWLGTYAQASESVNASRAYEALWGYAQLLHTAAAFPRDAAALGRRLKVLDETGKLKAIYIAFSRKATETAKVWTFERTANADGLTVPLINPTGKKNNCILNLRHDGRPKELDLTDPVQMKAEFERDKSSQEVRISRRKKRNHQSVQATTVEPVEPSEHQVTVVGGQLVQGEQPVSQ